MGTISEAQKKKKKEGLKSMREEGCNCCNPRWIHTTNERPTHFTHSVTQRGSRATKSERTAHGPYRHWLADSHKYTPHVHAWSHY